MENMSAELLERMEGQVSGPKCIALRDHVVASALRPGVVLGELDDGRVNYITSLEDLARGEIAGFNARTVGGSRELFPRISRADYEATMLADLPEVPGGIEGVLSKMRSVPEAARLAFARTRKLVRQDLPDGTSRAVIVARVPAAKNEAEIVAEEEDGLRAAALTGTPVPLGDTLLDPEELNSRARVRKYTLSQLLSDPEVLEKYPLGVRQVETAKRMAVTDAVAAAAMFQSLMNSVQKVTRVIVKPGDYARDRPQAKNAIRQICAAAPRNDVAVKSLVMMDKLMIFGPEGERDWHVVGPLKYATEVSYVYWFVKHEGLVYPSIALALELVLLHIDIYDGFSYAEPVIEYHSALPEDPAPPVGLSRAATSLVSIDTRMQLAGMADRLLGVYGDNGKQLATAVRVTDRYVLLNAHVVDGSPRCTVDGMEVNLRTQMSRDVWCARLDGSAEPWPLREPVVGELAVVCYRGDGGVVSCSDPVRITSVDASCVVTQLDSTIMRGMSGGAVVALSDLSLLGIHGSVTRASLVAYRFGPRQFSELLETDSVTSFSRAADVGSFAEKVVQVFKKRGIWNVFHAAVASLEPVHVAGKHIGMAVNNGAHTYTLCDPDLALQLGRDRRAVAYESCGGRYYRTPAVTPGRGPAYRRAPSYYEKVFVVGYDTDFYISVETTVSHVGPDARSFTIADIPAVDRPMLGGLVVAWDGAVLGCCGPRSMTTAIGLGYPCWPLVREDPAAVADPRESLGRVFPFLNVTAWSNEVIEEIFTHSSVAAYRDGRHFNAGMKPLANIGDNVAKAELYRRLRELGVPHAQWSALMQGAQSNNAYAEVAWRLGFAASLVVGSGVTVHRESKPYADLTEAVIGAAYLYEKPEVVTQLCETMGILYTRERPGLSRSVSVDDESSAVEPTERLPVGSE